MNALVPTALDGELLSPHDTVRVVGKTHPLLSSGRIDCVVRAGSSITEILIEALSHRPDMQLRRDFVVHIDGHLILEKNWSRVRVKKGATITFTPRLQNGGAVWRQVLSVVVAVAAIVIAPYLAPGIVAGLGAIGITASIATATALAAGGIILAGTLAMNALFPVGAPAVAETVETRALNSIQGAQNQSNLFGPIPVVLGRHRQSPFYAAKPYSEIVGDDQYLRMLFCLGYGPLVIEDIKIGETPLTSFSTYQIEVLQGFPGDADPTLYPKSVDEQALSITLSNTNDPPGGLNIGGTWQRQNTAADTDEISLDFTAPQGCYEVNANSGNLDAWSIYVHTRYRAVGDVAWTNGPTCYIYRSPDPTRVGTVISVARGQYEVEARKARGDALSDKIRDQVVWTALRSIRQADPVTFPKPLSFIALRIRASDQLSGVINTLNCITTSLVKAYSGAGSVWNDNTASQSPADLFRHVLQAPPNNRPVPDSQIDLDNLQEWWAYCVSKGFKFNQVVTTRTSVYDKLTQIAAAGRAVVTFINGKWGVIWDRPDDTIVQHFTPRNSWGFRGQRTYAQQPHGWRTAFINEDNGFTQDERIVYDDGYSSANATLFEALEFPGVTDPDLIWKHGRFHIAQSRLRPERMSISVGWENLVCTRGDRVHLSHDVALIGLASGRIKSVVGQVVTFDEMVTIEDGKTYGFRFRVPEDIRSFRCAVDATPAGDYFSLTLVGDLSLVREGTLFSFGETEQESAVYRVFGISHQKDLIATITLVDDAPDIATADTGVIPEYTPNITIPPDPFTLPPRDLTYLEVIDGYGASVRALVRLTWQVPRFGKIVSFEVQRRDDEDVGSPWVTVDSVPAPRTKVDVPILAAGVWSFRVRCIFDQGPPSAWASLLALNLAGLTSAPGDITNLHQHSIEGQTVLDWDVVSEQRIVLTEVRKGTSWDTGLVVGDAVTQPPWPTTGDGTYFVRSYVLSPFGTRIYSDGTASITIADSIISRNIILSKDEQADGWTGALDGGVIDGSFIRTDIGQSVSTPVGLEVVSQLELDGLYIAVYISPVTVNIGRAAECRYWTLFEASGVAQGADFLAETDVLGSLDILGSEPTRFIRAFPIWRFADTGEGDVFAPSDIFDPTDIFTAEVDWGPWVATASGTRVSRYYQPGYVLITDKEDVDATGTKFSWFVDVPDRTDDYTELDVPNTGLDVVFYPGGYATTPGGGGTPTPFNGGPNGSLVPHVQRAIVDGNNGDEVKITNLTLSGCTVHVVNAGSNVIRDGVNLLIRGY